MGGVKGESRRWKDEGEGLLLSAVWEGWRLRLWG